MANSSQFVKVSINDYAGAAQDISQYVNDVPIQRDQDVTDGTTFRTGGKSVTKTKVHGPTKSEFTISLDWCPTLDYILEPLCGNNSGTLLDIRMGNGAAPTTNDDKFSGTYTVCKIHYDYSATSTAPAGVKIDVKPTDGGTAPSWSKI